jgi:ketopantoate reductase
MNGYVVAKGKEKGVPTPVSAAVVKMIHEVENGTRKQAAENIGETLKRAGV